MNLPGLSPSLFWRTTRATALLGPIALLVLLAPPTTKAASTTWTAGSGQWNTEASWNDGLPTISDTAVIDNGNTVSTPALVTGNYRELQVGITAGGGGVLDINGGLLSGTAAYLGYAAGGTGSVTVTSGTWNNSYFLAVGLSGTGTLAVNGGTVTNSTAYLGYNTNSHGSAMVTSGTWYNSYGLVVGGSGTGTLTVNGGTVINSTAYLGDAANSHGSATVTSGTWMNSFFSIGNSGTGTLAVNGGTVTSSSAYLGYSTKSHGSATVTSGTWNSTHQLHVGYSGTGTLAVNGGTVTNSTGYLGFNTNSHGSAAVTSGTWNNTADLFVGRSGTGTLAVNGGTVLVSGTTFTGSSARGNGTITLSRNEDHRGVLETMAIAKGLDLSNIGTGKVSFDGGIIRALANTDDFFLRYEAGDVTFNAGGAFVDTAEFTIGINAPLAGEGALHKLGIGTLTLGGTNTYTGGTVVEAGTLTATHQDALGTGFVTVKSGGAFTIQSGVTVTNAIVLEGGSLSKTVANGASLAGAINTSTTLGEATSAELLGGTTSAVTTLQASFSATSSAENDDLRLGGVLHLSGVHVINVGTGETDQFVLQLQVAGVTTEAFLGWLDTETNQWVNAVAGNIGGEANFLGDKAYNAATDFQLGNYGIDTANGTVWAVLNHNSEFAVVPEPGTWTLLLLGAGAMLHRARKRREV